MKKTLSIIKPDATSRNISEEINKIIEEGGLKIVEKKELTLSKEQAMEFYEIHNDKPFYNDLVNYMISSSIVVQILEGENAVNKYRDIMGSTNPKEAKKGTIRNKFGISIQENSVHGSDSEQNAIKEINFFFGNNSH